MGASRFWQAFSFLSAPLLLGCAIQTNSAAQKSAETAWSNCIWTAIPQMDDGKSDPVSIAYGIGPRCAAQYNALSKIMIDQMITENSQDYMRAQMQNHEVELITSAVLTYRSSQKHQ